MCSRPFRPVGLPIYVARPRRLHSSAAYVDTCVPAHLKLVRFPARSPLPIAGLAFYVAFPKSSIRPLGLPIYVARVPAAPFTRSYPRRFTFCLADPIRSIQVGSQQHSLSGGPRMMFRE